MPKTQKVVDLKNICIRKKLDEVSISKTLVKNSRPNSSAKENSISTGLSYQTGDNSMVFGNSIMGSQNNRGKSTNNVILAPISTQYLSNNSIFNNLATKRRWHEVKLWTVLGCSFLLSLFFIIFGLLYWMKIYMKLSSWLFISQKKDKSTSKLKDKKNH